MGETAANYIKELEGMMDDLPEEEKKGKLGKIIKYMIGKLVESGLSFYQALQNVDELCTLLKFIAKIQSKLQDPGRYEEAVREVIDFQEKNAPKKLIDSFCSHLYGTLSPEELCEYIEQEKISHEQTKELILDKLTNYQQDRSNELVKNMATVSAVVAALQVVKIYKAWKTISDASNLITENPNKIAAIKENVEKMESMVLEFLELCETNPTDSRISQKMTKINTLFYSTLGKISNLRVKIDGHIQCLDLIADYSAIDGAVNAATAVSHGIQVWHAWANLTSFTTKVLGTLMTAVFTGLSAANFTQFYLSRKALKGLREDLKNVSHLQNKLQDLHEKAAEAHSATPD